MTLIEHIIKGDEKAFRLFYEETYAKLFSFSLKHTSNNEVSKEIVQEAYVVLWEKKNTILPKKAVFEAYLYTVVKRKCITFYKQKIVACKTMVDTTGTAMEIPDEQGADMRPDLYALLDVLPSRQRLIIELVKLRGLSYKEVASELNISERTVETHLRRAFTRLRLEAKYFSIITIYFLTLT
ncbi:MAG: RNA polymerase sigma factor [Mesonia hippocampi]|uniref:RNA polymerase sigma factor n=1 Tax=Mesonia hippocampi TaxID=1628250 RepID=UPI003F967BE9